MNFFELKNLSRKSCLKILRGFHIGLDFVSHLMAAAAVVAYCLDCWNNNEAFYRIDVDYVRWVTNLPAYTICPTAKASLVSTRLNSLVNANSSEVIRFVRGLMNPSGKYCKNCEAELIKATFKDNFGELVEVLSEPCELLLVGCFWNSKPFQCCRYFKKIRTNNGFCFSLNSAENREVKLSDLDMTTGFLKPKAELKLELTAQVRVYVHDGKNLNLPRAKFVVKKIGTGQKAEIVYKFMEWTEDPSSLLLPLSERNCILADEIRIDGFHAYSQSACITRCAVADQMEKCKCKHHLLPGLNNERDCDLEGLKCLDREFKLSERRKSFDPEKCGCVEACSRVDVSYVRYTVENSTGRTSKVLVKLAGPPTERVTLTSRTNLINLTVTVACLSRLVTNKSLYEMIRDIYINVRSLSAMMSGKLMRSCDEKENLRTPSKIQ